MMPTWSFVATLVLVRLDWAILVYFVAVNTGYAVLLFSATCELIRYTREAREESRWRLLSSRVAPSITVLAPAHNEAATIIETVRGFLALYYPNLEVLVVNDGSTDATMDALIEEFELEPVHAIYQRRIPTKPVRAIFRSRRYPNLWVADKDNGGKADALNAGLNMATGDLVCAIDADTLIEPDALQRMVRPFFVAEDLVAAGGTIRVVNGCLVRGGRVISTRAPRRALTGFQVIEYLRAFLFGRLGWNRLGGNLIVSGAFGLFKREPVIAIGGYTSDTVGEDMELVLRLVRRGFEEGRPHRVDFIPDTVAWTQAPDSLRVLARQRDRWHRGLAEGMWRHRVMLLNPRYRATGMFVYPFFLGAELLGPIVEAVGYVGLAAGLVMGAVNMPFAILFFAVAYGYALVLNAFTLVLEKTSYDRYDRVRDTAILLGWVSIEYLGYHQLTVAWRVRGLVGFLRRRSDWGVMEHRGYGPAPDAREVGGRA